MLSISKTANPNYVCKIVKLENLRKHENADKLQVACIDFQNVIVGLDEKDSDICVFFPVESQINANFIKFLNAFRENTHNADETKKGFFEDNCRVKAVKLRGEKSMGFVVPIKSLESFIGQKIDEEVGTEFDYVNDIKLVNKYEIFKPGMATRNGRVEKRISRLVEGQFHFHVDTENLRKNANNIKPEDYISVSYKVHGTSSIFSRVLVKRKLNLIEKFVKLVGVKVQETEYDLLYSSRKVVKNEYETKDKCGFYSTDIWGDVKNEIADKIPEGYTIYGEIIGFTKDNKQIQAQYDYGCEPGQHKFQVYRITVTNAAGQVINLSTAQIREFCERVGLETVHYFYEGFAKDMFPEIKGSDRWSVDFVKKLEEQYTDKNCFMCKNEVPEEGVVVRKDLTFSFEGYKLKSFSFLEFESKELDKGEVDMESAN